MHVPIAARADDQPAAATTNADRMPAIEFTTAEKPVNRLFFRYLLAGAADILR